MRVFILLGVALLLTCMACNMPSNPSGNDDLSKWFDVSYDGSDTAQNLVSNDQGIGEKGDEESTIGAIAIGDALKGTYAVVIQQTDGQVVQGSGFLLDKNLLVTNHHVVEKYNDGFVRLNDKSSKYQINEVLKIDRKNDVAILRVESIYQPFVLPLSRQLPSIGDRIYALGCPKGLEGTISSGIVSQFREDDGRSISSNAENADLFQTDVQINHGSSGGPVVNEKGHVIGIAMGGYGDGLNYFVPARFIQILNQGTF